MKFAEIGSNRQTRNTGGAGPISIGGDHSITGSIVQTIGRGKITNGEPVSALSFVPHPPGMVPPWPGLYAGGRSAAFR